MSDIGMKVVEWEYSKDSETARNESLWEEIREKCRDDYVALADMRGEE